MHTIREITRLASMLAVLIAPQLRLGFVSASISCEHCRSSRNNPHCAPRHVIYYFIAPLLEIRFAVPAKRVETAIFNPRGKTLKVGLQTSVSTRSTGATKLVFSVRNVQIQCVNNTQKSDILVLVAFLRTSKRVRIIS